MIDQVGDETRKLTPKQERFVSFYVGQAKFNATRAATLAGYSAKTARSYGWYLKNLAPIRARVREILEAEALSGVEVLAELSDVARRGLDECVEIVARDAEGNPIAARMDARAKMTALELLGKHHQLFSENLNLSGGIEIREYIDIPEDLP